MDIRKLLANSIVAAVALLVMGGTAAAYTVTAQTITAHTAVAWSITIDRPFVLGDELLLQPIFPFSSTPTVSLGFGGSVDYRQSARYQTSFGAGDSGSVGFFVSDGGASLDSVGFAGDPLRVPLLGQDDIRLFVIDQWVEISITCVNAFVCSPGSLPDPEFVRVSMATDDGIGSVTRIGSVPEPSTWLMMILGFAGLSFMAYRRQRRPDQVLPSQP